jgi:hypothetical protein
MSKRVGTHSFAMALLWTGKCHVSPVWGLGTPRSSWAACFSKHSLKKIEVPGWAAIVLPGTSSMLSPVGLGVVHIFQLGSNVGYIGGRV